MNGKLSDFRKVKGYNARIWDNKNPRAVIDETVGSPRFKAFSAVSKQKVCASFSFMKQLGCCSEHGRVGRILKAGFWRRAPSWHTIAVRQIAFAFLNRGTS
jgi:hypothetical protein